MSIGIFTDKKHQPTEQEILAAVGPQLPAWNELTQFVRENYADQEELKFMYGKKYGWAYRFLANKKLAVNLYPAACGFVAQINLPEDAVQRALSMDMSHNVQQAIAAAFPFSEGRWIFIPVETEQDVQDIKRLLELRFETRHGLQKRGK